MKASFRKCEKLFWQAQSGYHPAACTAAVSVPCTFENSSCNHSRGKHTMLAAATLLSAFLRRSLLCRFAARWTGHLFSGRTPNFFSTVLKKPLCDFRPTRVVSSFRKQARELRSDTGLFRPSFTETHAQSEACDGGQRGWPTGHALAPDAPQERGFCRIVDEALDGLCCWSRTLICLALQACCGALPFLPASEGPATARARCFGVRPVNWGRKLRRVPRSDLI